MQHTKCVRKGSLSWVVMQEVRLDEPQNTCPSRRPVITPVTSENVVPALGLFPAASSLEALNVSPESESLELCSSPSSSLPRRHGREDIYSR